MARARLWFEHPYFVVLVHRSGNVEAICLGNAERKTAVWCDPGVLLPHCDSQLGHTNGN